MPKSTHWHALENDLSEYRTRKKMAIEDLERLAPDEAIRDLLSNLVAATGAAERVFRRLGINPSEYEWPESDEDPRDPSGAM